MNIHSQTLLDEAKRLNEAGQYGEAIKQAYHASENVAAAYLFSTSGQHLLPNDKTYDLFAKTIREPNRHSDVLQKIKETVGKVSALREVYEPALLDEATPQDARQMIDCVAAMDELIGSIVRGL